MANDPSSPRAGGALFAGALLAGLVIGAIFREAVIGTAVGFLVGLVALLFVWWRDRA